MGRPKKRGPGRPKGSKTKKRGPGRPPGAKNKKAAKSKAPKKAARARAPKKALSRTPARVKPIKVQAVPSLVAGKFVIATAGRLLVRADYFNAEDAAPGPQFRDDHSMPVDAFQVFDTKAAAVGALNDLRLSFGLTPPESEKKALDDVDLGFEDEPAPKPEAPFEPTPLFPEPHEVETPAEPPQTMFHGTTSVEPHLNPDAPDNRRFVSVPVLDPQLIEALVRADAEPAGKYFATHYEITAENQLVKSVRWKDRAVTLASAVSGVKKELVEQINKFKKDLKEFDTKVSVARKDRELDVKESAKVLENFLKVAASYA